jgi:hypothetical protein
MAAPLALGSCGQHPEEECEDRRLDMFMPARAQELTQFQQSHTQAGFDRS